MMENQWLKVNTKADGAELTSILLKEDHTEYLWQGDPKVWGRHAPILFPIVGRLKENTCIIDGKEYHMTQHGFARDMTFDTLEESEDHRRSPRIQLSSFRRRKHGRLRPGIRKRRGLRQNVFG